jgi:hypothetical protein
MNLNYVTVILQSNYIFTYSQKENFDFDEFWFGDFSLMLTAVGSGIGLLIDLYIHL